jgi:hypothetical protein
VINKLETMWYCPDTRLGELKKNMNTQVTCLLAVILTRTFQELNGCAKHLSQTFGWSENLSYLRGFSFVPVLSFFIA